MRRIWLDTLILLLLCAAAPLWLALAYTGQRSAVFGASDLSAMLPMEGVHEQENLADRPGTFRWTDGSARIQPPNPGGELQLLLRLSSGLDEVTPVVLRAGKGDTQSFFALPGLRTYYLLLPSQPGERVTIAIESPTRTIDRRDLGVVFSGLSIAGTGSPPPLLIGAMLLATVGVYLLLCQAQFGQVAAPAIILVLQAAMAAWQYVGLWRYGLLSSLLGAVGVAALVAIGIEHIFLALPRQERPIAAPIRFRDLLRPPHLIPLVLLLMLAIACCLPWQHKPDPVGDLELAARRMGFMYERGGLNQAFVNGSDLMPFWLYTLCVLAPFVHVLGGTFYDPVPDITHTLIKVPSMLSLLATVTLLYWWGVRYANQRRAILIAALYAAIPPVWINAAWWGQVDVLISLPMIASLLLLDYGRGRWSWILWGTATMVKVHAVILAPVLFLLTLRRHGTRGLVEGGAFASLVIGLFCLPLILTGGGPGLYQAIIGSVGRFPQATNRAYNLWWLVVNGQQITDLITVGGLTYRTIGFILLVVATGLSCLAIIRRSGSASSTAAAATIALAFFTLPTQIHERYSFFVMPLLLLCAITDLRALIPFALITITATVNVIGAMPAFVPEMAQVIANSNIPALVAWVNVLTLIGLLIFAWVERREW